MYYVQNAESGQTETWKVGARYRLLSVLGCGSYGAVCKAADVHARRLVALKRVPDALNTLESAKRVLREVVVLNRLDHPNIIKVFDMFYTPATSGARRMNPETFSLVPVSIDLYMAFEIADGGDLFELRGEMSAAEVRSLMRQLAGAVKYLHDVGVWHRDIKSANTLCGRNRAGAGSRRFATSGSPAAPPPRTTPTERRAATTNRTRTNAWRPGRKTNSARGVRKNIAEVSRARLAARSARAVSSRAGLAPSSVSPASRPSRARTCSRASSPRPVIAHRR